MSGRYDDEREEFLDELTDLLAGATREDQRIGVAELRTIGVPANTAHMIARESANVRDRRSARALAERATADIFNQLEADAEMSPAELAAKYMPNV